MDPIKVTLPDGAAVEVTPDALALPEGYGLYGPDTPPDGYTRSDRFDAELTRRLDGKLKNGGYLKAEDAETDDFFAKLARKRGIQLGDDLKPIAQLDPEKLKGYERQWEEDKLKPVATEAERLKAENERLMRANVNATAQAALLDALKPDVFKPPVPGTPSTFDALVQHFVKFDDEGRPYFQAGADGMPEPDVPAAILKYLRKHNADLLLDKRNGSSGLTPGGDGGAKTITREAFDKLPEAQKHEAVGRIRKGDLTITD